MKNILCLVCLLAFAVAAPAQSTLQTLFKQYETDKDFTTVYISEYMFALLADVNTDGGGEEQEVLEMAKGLKELVVLSTEKNAMEHYESAKNKLNTATYKPLMSVREEGENVQILAKEEGKKIVELLVLVGSTDEFVLVSLVGDIDLARISKLSQQTDMKGLEHLEKINKE